MFTTTIELESATARPRVTAPSAPLPSVTKAAVPATVTNATCAGTATRIPSGSRRDRKSTRLNSSHSQISYAVFCLKKKKNKHSVTYRLTWQHLILAHRLALRWLDMILLLISRCTGVLVGVHMPLDIDTS